MIGIEQVRAELGEQSKVWSDEQLIYVRNMLYNMAELSYQDYLEKEVYIKAENNYNDENDLEQNDTSMKA